MGTSRITVTNEADGYRINEQGVATLADAVLSALGLIHHELSVSFVDEDAIRELNKKFRQKDRSTDVLSFPQMDWKQPLEIDSEIYGATAQEGPPPVLGDLVISPKNAERNALNIGQPLDREILFLMVHGVLHLCGHDHEEADEEAKMLIQQQNLIEHMSQPQHANFWQRCCVKHEVTK